MSEELKPCALCGGSASLNDYTDKPVGAWVLTHRGLGCILRIVDSFQTEESAITAWNRRSPLVGSSLGPLAQAALVPTEPAVLDPKQGRGP